MTELLNTPENPTSILSRIKEFQNHPDRFMWGVVAAIPLICAILPFELGIDAWTNLLAFVVFSAVTAWQDVGRLKQTQRHAPEMWTISVIPLYLWQRLTRNNQSLLPLLGWAVASIAAISLSFHGDKQALAEQACQVTTEIVHEQLNGSSDCVAVKIDEEIKDGFYRATATLDNGNDLSITIDNTSDDKIYVRVAN